MTNENEQKVLIAFKEKLKLHIILSDGSWRNGFVTEPPRQDFFTFKDGVLGIEHIFFMDVGKIEIYKEEGRK